MKLSIDGNNIPIKKRGNEVITIPASSVTEISYGQDVHRRVGATIDLAVFSPGLGALLALSKAEKALRRYYLGRQWQKRRPGFSGG